MDGNHSNRCLLTVDTALFGATVEASVSVPQPMSAPVGVSRGPKSIGSNALERDNWWVSRHYVRGTGRAQDDEERLRGSPLPKDCASARSSSSTRPSCGAAGGISVCRAQT
jgi:hypothetical protein